MFIEKKVKDYILRKKLISAGDRILLSVSAGKDSMAMIDILRNLCGELDFSIALFHLNHKMRGEESDSEEEFLRNFARENNIELFALDYDFTAEKKSSGSLSFEEFARAIRYKYLGNIAMEQGFNRIATAHNKNDNLETVLMRIFLGTGIHGLRGIPASRQNIIRPILILSVDEIYSYLKNKNIPWMEDSSNRESSYLRNYIRNKLHPLIKNRFPNAENSVMELSNLAEENSRLIENLIEKTGDKLYIMYDGASYIKIDGSDPENLLLKYKLAKSLQREFSTNISRPIINEILKNLKTEKTNNNLYEKNNIKIQKILHDGFPQIKISNDNNLILDKWSYCCKINELPKMIYIKEIDLSIRIKFNNFTEFVNKKYDKKIIFVTIPDNIEQIYFRNRINGDKIQTESGNKKIKDILIEKKLDNESKERIPLLIADEKIAALIWGFIFDMENRVSEHFKIYKDNNRIISIEKAEFS